MLNNKLSSIEFLRFISALAVVFYHYNQLFINFDNNLLETLPFFSALKLSYVYGHYAVEIFFTTSGFIFSHVYLHLRKNVKLKEFFVNRSPAITTTVFNIDQDSGVVEKIKVTSFGSGYDDLTTFVNINGDMSVYMFNKSC